MQQLSDKEVDDVHLKNLYGNLSQVRADLFLISQSMLIFGFMSYDGHPYSPFSLAP